MMFVWYQIQIQVNINEQMKLIHEMKDWIKDLEQRKIIDGYAFNHYLDDLSIRFNCTEEQFNIIKKEVIKVLHKYGYKKEPRFDIWGGENHILQAYEFGSRCTFLIWDLIEKERIPQNYLSNFYRENDILQIPFQFQQHFSHGLMNSLGIHKYPNEQILHLTSLFEYTKSKNIDELYKKLKQDKILQNISIMS